MDTKPKHTPGPWVIDTSGKYCPRECVRHNGIIVALIGRNTGGYIRQQDVGAQLEAERGNARLISAAPLMYEALTEARTIVQDTASRMPTDLDRAYLDLLAHIDAALRAARGQ